MVVKGAIICLGNARACLVQSAKVGLFAAPPVYCFGPSEGFPLANLLHARPSNASTGKGKLF